MPLTDVTNLATAEFAAAKRKRDEEDARRAQEAADLKRLAVEQRADEATGPAALLDDLQAGRKAAVGGDVLKNAQEDRFLNEQRRERLSRREADLTRRGLAAAADTGPSIAERTMAMGAPLGRFFDEDASARAQELKTNPRGRLADIDQRLASLDAPVSRETAPIYTDAPNAGRKRRPAPGITTGGDGPETMPYTGALDELLGMDVPRAAIRKEFGGTAEDRTLSFSDRREPGMRVYQDRRGTARDVGAPGGGLISAAGAPDTRVMDAQRAGLQELRGEAERAPFAPRERAADLAVQEPGWDTIAAEQGPQAIGGVINEAVGAGRLNPATGQYLLRKYAAVANDADEGDGPDPKLFAERLRQGRPPAPGEVEARATTGGQAIPQAQAAEQAAVAEARQPPQDGPGSTRSPALANAPGFFAGLAGAAQRGTERLGPRGPETPEGAPGPGDILRVAAPALAAMATSGASVPISAVTGFGTGVGSELLAELMNGETIDPKAIGATGIMQGLGGALVPAVSRVVGRGFNAVRSMAKRARPGAIPGVYGDVLEMGAPTRVLGGLREEAGAAREGMSSLARARQGSAEVGSRAIPDGPVPYLRENLPALRGANLPMGPGAEAPLDIEALIADYIRRSRRALPPGVTPDETLPALRGGGFVMR